MNETPGQVAVEGVWITGYESGELLDAAEVQFVLDLDEDRMDEPIAVNPKPFADAYRPNRVPDSES